MSKKDTTYADAMNQWAAKQSFLRNRGNRFLHPNPELPAFAQALGYLMRLAIVIFILWIIVAKLANKYYNSPAFNEKLNPGISHLLDAEALDTSGISWDHNKAVCKSVSATGNESAFYRHLDATGLSFHLPLFKRMRSAWTIDQIRVENLSVEFKSGGKTETSLGSASRAATQLISAGLLPTPDFSELTIKRVSCGQAEFNWGLTRSTLGAIGGAKFELTNLAGDWRLDLADGLMRQNWLRDLHVEQLTARKGAQQVTFSNSTVWLGKSASRGTLEGNITMERIPRLALVLRLPKVDTRDLLPDTPNFPEYFNGELDLSLDISGSINTMSGVETAGRAKILSGAFSKIPVFDAIDQLLKTGIFRVFTAVDGQVEFDTSGGQLHVTKFACASAKGDSIIRGSFTYTRGINSKEAAEANSLSIGGSRLIPKDDHILGNLRLGVRPERIDGNPLAQRYFNDKAEGYVWIDVPLDGPLNNATKSLHAEILTALRASNP